MQSYQSDSTFVSEEPIENAQEQEREAHRHYPKKKTVYQVIRSLPRDATPAQQDSAVQAAFPGKIMTWPKNAKTTLPLTEEMAESGVKLHKLRLFDTPFSRSFPWKVSQEVVYAPLGVPGDSLPYRFRSDSLVTGVLMLSFFLVVLVVSRSRHFLVDSIKNIFGFGMPGNKFDSRTETELRGQIFLIFHTCFLLGILFFDYTQTKMTEVFNQVSPYMILGMSVGVCALFCALKIALYGFVNYVFFDRRRSIEWTNTYLFSMLAMGLALLPLALLVVYYDLDFERTRAVFLFVLVMCKILLVYKCYTIFFNYRYGFLHLILYLCTLELMPLAILWRTLIYASNYLTLIF